MDRKRQIVKLFSASVLFIALMLPTIIQFVHVFDGHEHFVCTDQDSHVHQTPVDCEICTIQLVPYDSIDLQYAQVSPPEFVVLQVVGLNALQIEAVSFNSNPLRGPPTTILS